MGETIASAVLLALVIFGGAAGAGWLSAMGMGATMALVIFAAIYANTGGRFRIKR